MFAGRHAVAILVAVALGQLLPAASLDPYCDGNSTYAANGKFQANLDRLAAALPANASASPAGFAAAAVGAAPDQADAVALCRGDTNASSCAACVAAAFRDARRACPLHKCVTVYRDACVLRFAGSGSQFLDFIREDHWLVSELHPAIDTAPGRVNASDAMFTAAVKAILTALVDRTAASNTTRKYFATAEMDLNPNLYGLAQCAPGLTPAQCHGCLGHLLAAMTTHLLSGRAPGSRAFVVWCSLRYSVRRIYDGQAMLRLPAPSPLAPATTLTTSSSVRKMTSAAGIAAGIACFSVFGFLRVRRRIVKQDDHTLQSINVSRCTIFDLPTLREATEHFSKKNKLGEGGFGCVYKGILPDGQEIAVKTLLGSTGRGLHQLHNEVLVLAELEHKNLVRLQGFCLHQNDTMLVYEYIKNGSLDNFLFDDNKLNALTWEQQYNIIVGIAKGILYLHEESSTRIIHRDLKANNILLDNNMEPKIADFGLARLLGEGHTHTRTSKIAGTFGYMAPEYVMRGSVSPKIDIFSFGVLVLETVTRRRNCSSSNHYNLNLLSDVWDHWTTGTIPQMLHRLLDGHDRNQALRCIHVGLLCVQPDPTDRPDISTVVFMLTKGSMELQPPAQPAFFFGRKSPSASRSDGQSSYSDRSSSILEQGNSVNGNTLSVLYPR